MAGNSLCCSRGGKGQAESNILNSGHVCSSPLIINGNSSRVVFFFLSHYRIACPWIISFNCCHCWLGIFICQPVRYADLMLFSGCGSLETKTEQAASCCRFLLRSFGCSGPAEKWPYVTRSFVVGIKQASGKGSAKRFWILNYFAIMASHTHTPPHPFFSWIWMGLGFFFP